MSKIGSFGCVKFCGVKISNSKKVINPIDKRGPKGIGEAVIRTKKSIELSLDRLFNKLKGKKK